MTDLTTETKGQGVVYDDSYVTLTESELILKKFYFPSFQSKTIPLSDIEKIWIGTDPELNLSWTKKKTWGIALSNIWWACRWAREFIPDDERNFVIAIKNQEILRNGFSVCDPDTFLQLIKKHM